MGDKALAPILGRGTAVISLNGKTVLERSCLHVLSLRNTLYSLRNHQTQHECGYIGNEDMGGLYVYFPAFAMTVDTSVGVD